MPGGQLLTIGWREERGVSREGGLLCPSKDASALRTREEEGSFHREDASVLLDNVVTEGGGGRGASRGGRQPPGRPCDFMLEPGVWVQRWGLA